MTQKLLTSILAIFLFFPTPLVQAEPTELLPPSHQEVLQTLTRISPLLTSSERQEVAGFSQELSDSLEELLPKMEAFYYRYDYSIEVNNEPIDFKKDIFWDQTLIASLLNKYLNNRGEISLVQGLTAYNILYNFVAKSQDSASFRFAVSIVMGALEYGTWSETFDFNRDNIQFKIGSFTQTLINKMMELCSEKLSLLTAQDLIMEYIRTVSFTDINELNLEEPNRRALIDYNHFIWLMVSKEIKEGRGEAISNAFTDYLLAFRTIRTNERSDLAGALVLFFNIAGNGANFPGLEFLLEGLTDAFVYQLTVPDLGKAQVRFFLNLLNANIDSYLRPDGETTGNPGTPVSSNVPPSINLVLAYPSAGQLFKQIIFFAKTYHQQQLLLDTSMFLQGLKAIYSGVDLAGGRAFISEASWGIKDEEQIYSQIIEGENVRTVAKAVNKLNIDSLLAYAVEGPVPCEAALDARTGK